MKPTIIIRHRKENIRKCSLKGLETREDFHFIDYPCPHLPKMDQYIYLTIDAPPLSRADSENGLLILDGTWRLAQKMEKVLKLDQHPLKRSIPAHFQTAYPRKQTDCPAPEQGLASIEALALAYILLGKDIAGLMDGYYWKEDFLKRNQLFLKHLLSNILTL